MMTKPRLAPVKKSSTAGKVSKAALTRRRILDAAALWLNRNGAGLTSLQDLGDEINMRAASIYYHFPSKDALIEEVLKIGIENVHHAVRDAVESLGPNATNRQRIETAIAEHLSSLLSHGDYSSANIRNFPLVSETIQNRNRAVRRVYGDYWKELLTRAQEAGEVGKHVDLTLIRLLLMGALNWSTDWFNPEKMPIEEIASKTCDMLFDGIKPGGQISGSHAKGAEEAARLGKSR